jgi:hypothetical protein
MPEKQTRIKSKKRLDFTQYSSESKTQIYSFGCLFKQLLLQRIFLGFIVRKKSRPYEGAAFGK